MGKNPSTWKRVEKDVGHMYGGDRIPITGRARGSAADCTSRYPLGIEVKHRKALANYIVDGMDQAVASCSEGDTPIVVLHKKYTSVDDCYVVMRIKDHLSWTRKLFDDAKDMGIGGSVECKD